MHIKLELAILNNGKVYLNFWDSLCGNDICCEIINNHLLIDDDDQPISLDGWVKKVSEVARESYKAIHGEEFKEV
jgi:hypothetical protein